MDLTPIRRALQALPATCRYHGDKIDPPDSLFGRIACCDTGEPAMLRRRAEQRLNEIEAGRPHEVHAPTPDGPIDTLAIRWKTDADGEAHGIDTGWGRRIAEAARGALSTTAVHVHVAGTTLTEEQLLDVVEQGLARRAAKREYKTYRALTGHGDH